MSFNEQQATLIEGLRRSGISGPVRAGIRARLIETNMDLVLVSVRRLGGSPSLRSDLVQEGTIALIHAVDRFENQQVSEFPDYARQRIDRRVKRAFRRSARERKSEVNQPLEAFEDPAAADPFSLALHTELGREVETQLKKLSTLEERVLRLRFGIGTDRPQTLDAIARGLGLRPNRVGFLLDRALTALRRTSFRWRKMLSP